MAEANNQKLKHKEGTTMVKAIDTTFGGRDHLIHLQMMVSDGLSKTGWLDEEQGDHYISLGTVGLIKSFNEGMFHQFNLNGSNMAHFLMDCIDGIIMELVKCPLCGKPVEEWKRKSWEDYLWTGFNCEDECIDADTMGFYYLYGIFDYPVDKELNPIFKLEGYQPFIDAVIKQQTEAGDPITPIKQTPVTS